MNRKIAHILVAGTVLAAALTGCAAEASSGSSPDEAVASSDASAHGESSGHGESPASGADGSAPADGADGADGPGCTGDLTTDVPPVEVDVRFVDGTVEPAPDRIAVPLGATVVLRAEVDTSAEIHVHGYDVAAEAAPGEPACLEVLADTPGVYDVEAHPETLLLQLAVR